MCYNPRRILNPKVKSDQSEFNVLTDKVYIDVPCGHCGECQQRKMDSMYLRTIATYEETVKAGGFCFFNTFTFDEVNVPMWHGMRCFDSSLFRSFIVKLRVYLEREGFQGKMKYLWVSEYGGTTGRPHHHCNFFLVYPGLTPKLFGELCEKSWIYGFTQTNNPYDLDYYHNYDGCVPRDRDSQIKYVAKYVSKDFDFLEVVNKQRCDELSNYLLHCYYNIDAEDNQSFEDWILSHELPEYIDYNWLYKFIPREDYSRWLPFNRISQGFGVSLIKELDWQTLVDGYVMLPDKEKGMKKYMIPNYIDRKVFFNYDKNTRIYTLNDAGKQMKIYRLEHNTDYVLNLISSVFTNWHRGLSETKQFEVLDILNKICLSRNLDVQHVYGYSLGTPVHLSWLVDDLFDGRTFDDLYYYIRIFKDCMYRKLDFPLTGDVVKDYELCLYYDKDVSYLLPAYMNSQYQLCNDDPAFRNFDLIVDLYQELLNFAGSDKQEKYISRKRSESHNKHYRSLYYAKY